MAASAKRLPSSVVKSVNTTRHRLGRCVRRNDQVVDGFEITNWFCLHATCIKDKQMPVFNFIFDLLRTGRGSSLTRIYKITRMHRVCMQPWYILVILVILDHPFIFRVIIPDVVLIQLSSWGWAHSCSKHVVDSNKRIIEETVRQVGHIPKLYEDARSKKYKILWYKISHFTHSN
jgi:hypothetical protein